MRLTTPFNESLATAVERIGGRRWLNHASDKAREESQFDGAPQDFRAFTMAGALRGSATPCPLATQPSAQRPS